MLKTLLLSSAGRTCRMGNHALVFTCLVLVFLLAMAKSKETPIIVLRVCVGENITMELDFQKPHSRIQYVKIYRNGEGTKDIVIKFPNKEPKLDDTRAVFRDPVTLVIQNATLDDTAPYVVTVIFESNETETHIFQVIVNKDRTITTEDPLVPGKETEKNESGCLPVDAEDDPLVLGNGTEKNTMGGRREKTTARNNKVNWTMQPVIIILLLVVIVIQLVGPEKLKTISKRTWKAFKKRVRRDDDKAEGAPATVPVTARKHDKEKDDAGGVRLSMIVEDDNQEDGDPVSEPLIHKEGTVPCSPTPTRRSMEETKL